MEVLSTSNITFALGIIGVIFGIYTHFKKPQEELDKRQALGEKEADDKAYILAQQLQWEKESNERRFTEMNSTMVAANALAQNHTHSVEMKIDTLMTTVGEMGNRITELRTIIDERVPRK